MTATPNYQTIALGVGRHSGPDDGACVMELASMLAGERFSDHPRSVCPVIGSFLRKYNDGLDDERRQDLYAVAAKVVGTRDRRVRRLRARRCRERLAELQEARPTTRRPLWHPGAACAGTFLRTAAHAEALAFVDELIALGKPSEDVLSAAPREQAEQGTLDAAPN
jgi:hypothetical protein